jgi:hypothetical protein
VRLFAAMHSAAAATAAAETAGGAGGEDREREGVTFEEWLRFMQSRDFLVSLAQVRQRRASTMGGPGAAATATATGSATAAAPRLATAAKTATGSRSGLGLPSASREAARGASGSVVPFGSSEAFGYGDYDDDDSDDAEDVQWGSAGVRRAPSAKDNPRRSSYGDSCTLVPFSVSNVDSSVDDPFDSDDAEDVAWAPRQADASRSATNPTDDAVDSSVVAWRSAFSLQQARQEVALRRQSVAARDDRSARGKSDSDALVLASSRKAAGPISRYARAAEVLGIVSSGTAARKAEVAAAREAPKLHRKGTAAATGYEPLSLSLYSSRSWAVLCHSYFDIFQQSHSSYPS